MVHFEHKVLYKDLSRQFLAIYLLDADTLQQPLGPNSAVPSSKVISVYRIDLELLAIGPVHHSIELMRKGTGFSASSSQFCAKLTVDLKFVQTQKIEIQLAKLKAELSEVLKDSYQAGFRIISQYEIVDSKKTHHSFPIDQVSRPSVSMGVDKKELLKNQKN